MSLAAGAGVLAAVAFAMPSAAAPPPCGAPQIADATGDGHHPNTDVLAAWLSESAGSLQAVIRPRTAVWEPADPGGGAAPRRLARGAAHGLRSALRAGRGARLPRSFSA